MLRSKLLPAGCALALTLTACAENDTSLYVAAIMKGEPPECEFRADPGSVRLPSGLMDVGFTTDYKAQVLVGLQLATRGDKSKLRSESMAFQVRGAEVRLTNSVGELEEEFSVPSGGSVTPTSAETPGYGLSEVVLIPNDVGESLRDEMDYGERRTLVAELRVFGDTLGGAQLTSGSFNFIIDVCYGCQTVVIEDGLAPDPLTNRMVCNFAITEPRIRTGCYVGQDGDFDCRYCSTNACASFGG